MTLPDGLQEAARVRFGAFEMDFATLELRKNGVRLRIQKKPFQVLKRLVKTPGELVTRAELAQLLWPGLHVVFDGSLNTAVNTLRRLLSDPPRNPRFIETRPGIGYRFIAPLETLAAEARQQSTAASLAVLPFENASGDRGADYLADGLAESILAALSSCEQLRVIARSTAWRFRGPDVDPREAGRRLHVGTVLTGRIVEHGKTWVIGAELVDVQNGRRIWGEQYRRMPGETLGVDREIAAEAARQLGIALPAVARRNLFSNFDAYQDYWKGRFFYSKMAEEDLRKSVAYYEAALAAEPDCALAYSGLADTFCLFAHLGTLPAQEALARAGEYSEAALRIDDQLSDAHASYAQVMKLRDWDWSAAETRFHRALELNPNSARARRLYADLLSAMGRAQEAQEQIRTAMGLDPLSLVIHMEAAWHLYMARDFEASIEQSWRTLAMEPKFAPAQHTLGLAYEQMGMLEEAVVEFQNARACSGDHPVALAALIHARAAAGDRGPAMELLDELRRVSGTRHVSPYWLAVAHAGLEDDARALELLDQARRDRDVWLLWAKVEPRLDRLREDGRFQELVRGCGL